MKINKTKILRVQTSIRDIEESSFVAKNGEKTQIILLKTNDGIFSNFKSIWEKQHIDVESLAENTVLEITYVEHNVKFKNKVYKNFLTVSVIDNT